MHNYRVTINGRVYDVNVEDLGESKGQAASPPSQPAVMESAATQPAEPVTSVPSEVSLGAGEKPVVAPLSGVVVSLKVKPGEQVKNRQVLLTLEALKMENEIVAPEAGTVKSIFVQTGSTVNVGDVLLSIG